jgi:hypothetical protein
MFIVEQQFPQRADLSLAIETGPLHLAESVGLNPIDLDHDRQRPVETRGI